MNTEKRVYCESLSHWCESIEEAAQLGECNTFWLQTQLEKVGRAETLNGNVFTYKVKTEAKEDWRAENLKKARESRKKVVICLETGDRFDSCKTAAKYLNMSAMYLSKKLHDDKIFTKDGRRYVYEENVELVKSDEFSKVPLSELQKNHRIKSNVGYYCIQTGERFATIKEISEKLDIPEDTISMGINNFGKYVALGGYVYAPVVKVIKAKETKKVGKRRTKAERILVCLQTGEEFASCSRVAAIVGCHPTWVSTCMKNDGQFKKNGKTYVFKTSMSPAVKQDGNIIVCEDDDTRFESMELFSKYVGESVNLVSNIFKNNGKYITKDGYVFVLKKASTQLQAEIDTLPVKEIEKVEEEKPVQKIEEPKVVKSVQVSTPAPVVNTIVKTPKVRNEKFDERIVLEDTVISFTRKGLYKEAIIICESLEKIYIKD